MSPPRLVAALVGLWACLGLPAAVAASDCDPAAALGTPTPVPTGPNPLHALIEDFNEDGHPDLAVSNSSYVGGPGFIAIHVGNGTGTYGAPATIFANANPFFLATGDFNGDGILDLAATHHLQSQVGIYLGQGAGGVGNGSFAAPVTYPTGGRPFQIVTGDYDEDGILDLAMAINDVPRVSVLRGLGAGGVGNGTFAAPVNYPLHNLGRAIAQGDFNADGILDLVATEWMSGFVGILLGQGAGGVGNGTFAPAVHQAAGPEPIDLEIFDYDKDGILDLIVCNGANGGTAILRGQGAGGIGTGGFTPQVTLATGNNSGAVVLDVNEDGLSDILASEVASPVGRRLHLYLGNGDAPSGNGSWTFSTTIPLSDETYQLAVADLNSDTHPDVVTTSYNSDRLINLFWVCQGLGPDPRKPVLTRVRDVPADEGGHVYLTWLPSSLDTNGGTVNAYQVWRRIPGEAAGAAESGVRTTTRSERAPSGELAVTFWEEIATLPAHRLQGYGYTAPTTEDSTAENPVSTAFFISALTSNINVFHDSNVDSGASIDNLAPQAPANFRIEPAQPGMLVLAWAPNEEPDLERYHLYRSASADFPAEATALIVVEADTYTEAAPAGPAYYRVAAVDEHGNQSAFSPTISAGGTVGVADGVVHVLALAGARPNPASAHDATLLFSLASDAPATLEIYDIRGRRIATPSLAGLRAGSHAIRIDQHAALAPGLYLVRLLQGGSAVERKIAIAR